MSFSATDAAFEGFRVVRRHPIVAVAWGLVYLAVYVAMFGLGGTTMMPRAQQLVNEVAKSLQGTPNKLAVRGHTDAVPFNNAEGRNNWSLSAERAEVTRALLERSGIKESRFSKIEGVAE